jgi:hypothetical protein
MTNILKAEIDIVVECNKCGEPLIGIVDEDYGYSGSGMDSKGRFSRPLIKVQPCVRCTKEAVDDAIELVRAEDEDE